MPGPRPTSSTDLRHIRVVIARGKRWDLIFGICGVLALMVGMLTFRRAVRRHGGVGHSAP